MRLITRADFDGLGCAVLLKEIGLVHYVKFLHPKDIQDGKIEVTSDDILANMPYAKGCGLWFDHHSSEGERKAYGEFEGASDPSAPSATGVICDYYGREKSFPAAQLRDLVRAVDKSDSASFTVDEILNPTGWVLVSFIMDPRTGLGRYKDYVVGNYQFWMDMVDYCRTKTVDEILEIPDVKERVKRYFEQDKLFREMIEANTAIRGKVVVLDLRKQQKIYAGNRFVLYSLYPEQNVSIQVIRGLNAHITVLACGHSIINRTSKADVGSLMLKHGGGGHKRVGTCQVQADQADEILEELIKEMNSDGACAPFF